MTFSNIIKEQEISLQPITIEDTNLIVKWRNNPAVSNNFIYRDKLTYKIHKEWIEKKVLTGKVVQYIIKNRNIPVGSIYYRNIDYSLHCAELGIFIGDDNARGKGIGKKALKLFIKYGFEHIGLYLIYLRVLEENEIALKTYEKVGFKKISSFSQTVEIDNQRHNVVFMRIGDIENADSIIYNTVFQK